MNWDVISRAERYAAYNNSEAVKDSAQLSATREAAAFRAAHPGHLDVDFGPREPNKWDLFPATDQRASGLVFIHSGY